MTIHIMTSAAYVFQNNKKNINILYCNNLSIILGIIFIDFGYTLLPLQRVYNIIFS